MRALRRIATPASVAVALGGCSYPFDEYLPQKTDAGLTTNADARREPDEDTTPSDSGTIEVGEADTFLAEDTAPPEDAACACVKYTGSKCKEWSPPGCGD